MMIPQELHATRAAAHAAIAPIKPLDEKAIRETFWCHPSTSFLFQAKRTDAGRQLPEYHLVYFLLVDLLGFPNLGRWEKTDWSVPVDLHAQPFVIEYRKFGLGVFVPDPEKHETNAREVVTLIKKGVAAAEQFFSWLAEQAVESSKVNVVNRSPELFERFNFLLKEYQKKVAEAGHRPAYKLGQEAQWLALSAVEAFFSWTEHVLIHLAILMGRIKTAREVANLADSDWPTKVRNALDVSDPETKSLFDKLTEIRRQIRNFVAHGSFGKQGEAFSFHSGAGAVPVLLSREAGKQRFRFTGQTTVDDETTFDVIKEFIYHLWSGNRQAAKLYIQDGGLPSILTMASDGTYADAISSLEQMKGFIEAEKAAWDAAADMDW